jgi:hypothetical protein
MERAFSGICPLNNQYNSGLLRHFSRVPDSLEALYLLKEIASSLFPFSEFIISKV